MNGQGIGRGRQLRAYCATLIVLSLLGSLVLAGTASARTLSERVATAQATKLLKKQLRDRDRRLVEARILEGEKVSSSRWLFLYDDLNRQGVVCTAVLEVRLTGAGDRTITARFVRSSCSRPGSQALAYRAAARFAGTAFVRRERSILRSIRRYIDQEQACNRLNVPRDRRDEARLLLDMGLAQAQIRPAQRVIDRYARSLQSLGATEPTLAAGATAWRDFIDTVRALPKFRTSYCSVLRTWARNGYTDATAPVDFAALRASAERIKADGANVRRAGRLLRKRGIDPATVTEFTLGDLIGFTGTPTRVAKSLRAITP